MRESLMAVAAELLRRRQRQAGIEDIMDLRREIELRRRRSEQTP
jgi:hypothetical protein